MDTFSPGDQALVNYVDDQGRSVKAFCTIMYQHTIDDTPVVFIKAPAHVVDGLGGRISPYITDVAVVDPDELEPPVRILNLVVGETMN